MEKDTDTEIAVQSKVKTTEPNMSLRSEWSKEGWEERKWGMNGTVTSRHDSHGVCLQVAHEDGSSACYDPSELQLIT